MTLGLSWALHYHVWIGPVPVNVHSLGIAVGYVVGYALLQSRLRRRNTWNPAIGTAVLAAVPGVLIGARFFWALPLLLTNRVSFGDPQIWTLEFTNVSFLGGLVGGLATGMAWLYGRGVSKSQLLGLLPESVLVGLVCARIGDVLIGDHLGAQTSAWWGFELPEQSLPNGACRFPGDVCHQTALYELLFLVPLLAGAMLMRRRGASGRTVAAYAMGGYGLLRIVLVEPFRITPRLLGMTGSQWACGLLVLAALAVALSSRYRQERELVRADSTDELDHRRARVPGAGTESPTESEVDSGTVTAGTLTISNPLARR